MFLFPPAHEVPETLQKVIWEGAKGVIVVLVRNREKWLWSLGQIAVEWRDIPKGDSIFWDGKGKMLSQEGHLQYRAVPFDALGIEQEGLKQTSWDSPWVILTSERSSIREPGVLRVPLQPRASATDPWA